MVKMIRVPAVMPMAVGNPRTKSVTSRTAPLRARARHARPVLARYAAMGTMVGFLPLWPMRRCSAIGVAMMAVVTTVRMRVPM